MLSMLSIGVGLEAAAEVEDAKRVALLAPRVVAMLTGLIRR
jgi:hypothetical protein